MNKFVFIGYFPPPVDGLAIVNSHLCEIFRKNSVSFKCLSLTPKIKMVRLLLNFYKIVLSFLSFFYLIILRVNGYKSLFLPVDAKTGMIYNIAITIFAKWMKMKVILHHHSYLYIDKKSRLANYLFSLLDENDCNIVLSIDMENKISALYECKAHFFELPNVCYFPSQPIQKRCVKDVRSDTIRVGYIGRISEKKGVQVLFDLASEKCIQLTVAGIPEMSKKSSSKFFKLVDEKRINYLGPVFGEDKEAFFSSIDLLILPSKTETQPLVLFECIARGLPFVSTDKGTIKYDFYGCEMLLTDYHRFSEDLLNYILRLKSLNYQDIYDSNVSFFKNYYCKSENQLTKLIESVR